MRRIISLVTLSLALAGGTGAAMASPRGHEVATRREAAREVTVRRDAREAFHDRGRVRWGGHDWRWVHGRYVRC